MLNKCSTVQLSEYSILSCDLDELEFDPKCIINTINQYSYIIAEKDDEFKQALINSDVLLPDGVGVVAAVKLLTNNFIKKISGADLHLHLLRKLNEEHGRCFYLGSTCDTLALIKERLTLENPHVITGVYSPPFRKRFSKEENQEIIQLINKFQPDVLFVGMTAPKQEKWIYENKVLLNAKVICAIGGAFDFYAGTITRPSVFWQNLGLEWFVRFVKEPRRMFKRYIYYGPVFVVHLLRRKTVQLFPHRSN